MSREFILIAYVLVLFPLLGVCQYYSNSDRKNDFLLLRIGKGTQYGDLGGGIEVGRNNFGIYGSIGYSTKTKIDGRAIDASLNWSSGVDYFTSDNSKNFRQKVGLEAGWIRNYYYDRIGNNKYNPNVYGISSHLGWEFNFRNFNIEIGISYGFNKLIFNKSSHPYFSSEHHFALYSGLTMNALSYRKTYSRVKEEIGYRLDRKRCFELSDYKVRKLIIKSGSRNSYY